MTSENYVKGLIRICSDEKEEAPFIDYAQIKNLTIKETENFGKTGSVQLVNDYSNTESNLLSDYCVRWSDKKGRKLKAGMFLRIFRNIIDKEHEVGIFLITQIDVNDMLITLTFCDSLQYLRSVGADFVRNFYKEGSLYPHAEFTRWVENEARMTHDPGAVVYGGDRKDIQIFVPVDKKYENADTKEILNNRISCNFPKVEGENWLRKIKILNTYYTVTAGLTAHITYDVYINGRFVEKIHKEPAYPGFDESIEIDFKRAIDISEEGHPNLELVLRESTDGNVWFQFQQNVEGAESVVNGDVKSNTAFGCELVYYRKTDNVEGKNHADYFTIDSIEGIKATKEAIDRIDVNPNTWAFYLDKESGRPAGEVFRDILKAVNFDCDDAETMRGINMFRCNGGAIHDYLLSLTDMTDNAGLDQFGMCSDRDIWNFIKIGRRPKKDDDPDYTVFYAKDRKNAEDIPFISFNPSVSLRNNPRIAVSKGNADDGTPLMISLIDKEVPVGGGRLTLNGSANETVGAAMGCYSELMKSRATEWQGEAVLSGIVDLMRYPGEMKDCGGSSIRIFDSRYDFKDYKAKVREISHDYANQKTTITVNDYSEVYSNAILDTEKMAFTAGDFSVEGTSKDMFTRQFVALYFLDEEADGEVQNVSFHVSDGNGTDGSVDNASEIDFPELGIKLVNAYFPAENGQSDMQYGVESVKVGNKTHVIPPERRPDKYLNQALIVNVVYALKKKN